LHNLGQALASMGQYDQAIADYMRALDLRRSINDQHGAALESYGLGAVFDYQGRYGAAVNAKQEALKTFRNLKDRTFWMAEILGGYGDALILAGRGDEAKAPLDEALGLSRELKNDGLVGQTLGFQGDALFYQGNYKAAHALYDQALQAATRSKESERILLAKIALAQVQVREKSGGSAISNLKGLIEKADEASLKYSSTEAGIYMAEAMMQGHDNAHARQELQRDLPKADKLGQQALSAHAHYLLAGIARESNDTAESQNNYRLVKQTLETMSKDPGAEKLLKRADMKAMYDDSNHWLQGGK
jgi:tetratricopeptide (TPR) repeat protein